MMDLILQIPAQPATCYIPRQMMLVGLDFQNSVIAEAKDGKIPAEIRFTENDPFPWGDFLQKLAVAWNLSRNDAIPKIFQVKKPLPHEVVELIPQVPAESARRLLEELGKAGYFSAFHR